MSSPEVRLPASKRQLSLLGLRLAEGTTAPGDDELYEAMLDVYDRVQQATRSAIERIELPEHLGGELDVTGRTKTLDTLVQKLRRNPETRLPYIRDIAGVRVVGDFPVAVQRALAERLRDLLAPGGLLVDRIAEPASGYRAVHVVARIQAIPVEIQVRTRLQHVWAETFERVADRWGRQIRYGEPPDPGPVPEGELGFVTRPEAAQLLQDTSTGLIAATEDLSSKIFSLEEAFRSDRVRLPPEQLHEERRQLASTKAAVENVREELQAQLLKIGELIAEDSSTDPAQA